MRLFTLLATALTVIAGSVEAVDFLRILDLVGVENSRLGIEAFDDGSEAENNSNVIAYYSPAEDYIVVGPVYDTLSESQKLATILHELAHWVGMGERVGGLAFFDTIMSEMVAEVVAASLSASVYEGKYSTSVEDAMAYVKSHSEYREMQPHELNLVVEYINKTGNFLFDLLKKVDTKNELGLQ